MVNLYEINQVDELTGYEVITRDQEPFFIQIIDDWYRYIVDEYQTIPNVWDLLNGDNLVTTSHIEWLFDVFVASSTEREYGLDYEDEQYQKMGRFLIDTFEVFYPVIRRDVIRYFNKQQLHYINYEYDFLMLDTKEDVFRAISNMKVEVFNSPLQDVW